jgi:hypothetical protein
MGDVINLRKARKTIQRQFARTNAAANRAFYGRSKAERDLTKMRDAKARHDLDQHRVETGDER